MQLWEVTPTLSSLFRWQRQICLNDHAENKRFQVQACCADVTVRHLPASAVTAGDPWVAECRKQLVAVEVCHLWNAVTLLSSWMVDFFAIL